MFHTQDRNLFFAKNGIDPNNEQHMNTFDPQDSLNVTVIQEKKKKKDSFI